MPTGLPTGAPRVAPMLLDPARAGGGGGWRRVHSGWAGRRTTTWDGESLDDAVQLAASGCARVDAALREALRSSVSA